MISLQKQFKTLSRTGKILLAAAAVFALASTSSFAYYFRVQGTSEDNNAYGMMLRYTNEQTRDDVPLNEQQVLNPYEVIAIYDSQYDIEHFDQHEQVSMGDDGNLLISKMDQSMDTSQMNFAAFVYEGYGENNPPAPTTPFTINIYGVPQYNNALNGTRFYFYVDNVLSGSFVWSNEFLANQTVFSYTFDNLAEMMGVENAKIITISTDTPHYPDGTLVPEPMTYAYALMGMATIFGYKRKSSKK